MKVRSRALGVVITVRTVLPRDGSGGGPRTSRDGAEGREVGAGRGGEGVADTEGEVVHDEEHLPAEFKNVFEGKARLERAST